MKKLKWILNIVYVLVIVLPLLFTVFAYKDDLRGLILPPQVMNAVNGQSSDESNLISDILPDINFSDINPTYNDDFQFNPDDNSFSFSIDINSPLNQSISINSFFVTVTDGNGSVIGTIELGNAVTLVPGENSTISIGGTLSEEFVTFLQDNGVNLSDPNFDPENMGEIDINPSDLHLTNVTIDIGGIIVHMNDLSLDEFGDFGSNNGGE